MFFLNKVTTWATTSYGVTTNRSVGLELQGSKGFSFKLLEKKSKGRRVKSSYEHVTSPLRELLN